MQIDIPIIVTGANGLVGSHILSELVETGYTNIIGVVRKLQSADRLPFSIDNIKWVEGDILDVLGLEELIVEQSVIIHTAGLVSYHPKRRVQLFQVNEEGTANVVNAAIRNNASKLIHISSIAALGRKENQHVIDEKSDWVQSPYNTTYAQSKYLAEQQAWRGYYEGLPTTILNPSIILGVGDYSRSSLKLIQGIANGTPFYPIGKTGFVDAIDLAKFAVEAIQPEHNGQRYIINGHNLHYKSFFEMVDKALEQSPRRMPLTPLISNFAWRAEVVRSFFTGQEPILTKQTAKSSLLEVDYDNSKSVAAFKNDYTPIDVTIKRVIQHYLSKK